MHVGDCGETDLKALLGLIKLLLQRFLVKLRETQLVFRREHAEVDGRGTHEQILRSRIVGILRAFGLCVGAAPALDVGPIEQRLRQRHARRAATCRAVAAL